ncbi:MAG: heme-degrading monooxygenase HmoA [Maribacter sp.]|jgi:heme-degrading monooxygenase HmoA
MNEPYYAVIFTSNRTEGDKGYADMAIKMENLARQQPGFLGVESAKEDIGITVSYWKNLKSIAKWREHTEHMLAQTKGKSQWYQKYSIRICKVEREYHFYKE